MRIYIRKFWNLNKKNHPPLIPPSKGGFLNVPPFEGGKGDDSNQLFSFPNKDWSELIWNIFLMLYHIIKLIKSIFSNFIYLLVSKMVLLINSNQINFNHYPNFNHPPLIPPSKGGREQFTFSKGEILFGTNSTIIINCILFALTLFFI